MQVNLNDEREAITLECPDCGRVMDVERNDDPPTAVKGVLQCDRCSDGDFHSIEYFDAAGKWVDPVAHLGGSDVPFHELIRGEGWKADCPKCVASKFTCDEHHIPRTKEPSRG